MSDLTMEDDELVEGIGYSDDDAEDQGDMDEAVTTIGGERFDASAKHTKAELEEWADKLLREDANKELCKQCLEVGGHLPYGEETGKVEYMPATNKAGEYLLDDDGEIKYVEFPELECSEGHRWYKGEGPRRDIRGENPILFEPHLYNRKRRELLAKEGVVDPAYTMDRWGKRPTVGLYGRSHPQGRKINSKKQRKDHGAGFISDHRDLQSLSMIQQDWDNFLVVYKCDYNQKAMLSLQQDEGHFRVLEKRQGQGRPCVFMQTLCQGVP